MSGPGPRLCKNASAPGRRRIVFSIVFFRQRSPALLVLKLRKLETKFLRANLVFEFSHSQGHSRHIRDVRAMSASLPTPDILLSRSKRRSGP